jgi:hypothetical protein
MKNFFRLAFLMAITAALAIPANAAENQGATDDAAELAKKLANPIASLISVPLQYTTMSTADRTMALRSAG